MSFYTDVVKPMYKGEEDSSYIRTTWVLYSSL